jgi:hypothetical protein
VTYVQVTSLLTELSAAHDVPVAAVSLSQDTLDDLADIEAGCEREGAFGDTEEGEEGEARRQMALATAHRRLQTLTYTFVIDPDLAGRDMQTNWQKTWRSLLP